MFTASSSNQDAQLPGCDVTGATAGAFKSPHAEVHSEYYCYAAMPKETSYVCVCGLVVWAGPIPLPSSLRDFSKDSLLIGP